MPTDRAALVTLPSLGDLGAIDVGSALIELRSTVDGLTAAEAAVRLGTFGPNAVRSHRVSLIAVLIRQFANPIQMLLLGAAAVSLVVGQRTDAMIVTLNVLLSVLLGFVNELRSERAIEALHDRIRHRATVRRDGSTSCFTDKTGTLTTGKIRARALLATTLICAGIAIVFPYGPLSASFGFVAPSAVLLVTIVGLAAVYLALVDVAKRWFYAHLPEPGRPVAASPTHQHRRIERRASRFTL